MKSDNELIEAATKSFENVDVIEENGFSGGGEWITIAIPLAALAVQIAEFIFTHLVKSSKDNESELKKKEKRVVIDPNGDISLYDHSLDEVIEFIKKREMDN